MNRRRTSALFALLFLILIGIMDYPFIVRILNEQNQSAVVTEYTGLAEEMSRAEKEAYLEAARDYNRSLATGLAADISAAFSDSGNGSTGGETDSTYAGLLDMYESGVMAAVEIPRISVLLPVYHGTADEVLKVGAGHLEGSSLPVGGSSTHACIMAHRGLVTRKLFTDLDQLKEGDVFYLHVLDETYAYQVYETAVVLPEDTAPLKIEAGKDLVTLITCTPYGVNSHRIYVHGTRIPYEEAEVTGDLGTVMRSWWWIILTVILLIWMYVVLYWYKKNG